MLRPPPLPPEYFVGPEQYNELIKLVRKDEAFKFYSDACSVPIPAYSSVSTTTSIPRTKTNLTKTTALLNEDTTYSTYRMNTTIILGPSTAVASGSIAGIVVAIVIVLLIIFLVFGVWYIKFRKQGRGIIAHLPIKTYEKTNYLDNKARQNICWSRKKEPDSVSIPTRTLVSQAEYINIETKVATIEVQVEKRTSISSILQDTGVLNTGATTLLSVDSLFRDLPHGCENKSFASDELAPSSSDSSQEPLFNDEVDNDKMPNVPDFRTEDNEVVLRHESMHGNGHVKMTRNSLPPITGNDGRLSTQSDSPKKKGTILSRTSVPVNNGMEEIMQGDYRKTY